MKKSTIALSLLIIGCTPKDPANEAIDRQLDSLHKKEIEDSIFYSNCKKWVDAGLTFEEAKKRQREFDSTFKAKHPSY